MKDKQGLTVFLTREQHTFLKQMAAASGIAMTNIIKGWINAEMKNKKGSKS